MPAMIVEWVMPHVYPLIPASRYAVTVAPWAYHIVLWSEVVVVNATAVA